MHSSMQRCRRGALGALLLLLLPAGGSLAQSPDASDWGHVGGGPGGQFHSHLNEITRDNVAQLRLAWTWRADEPLSGGSTPMLAFGKLYLVTPSGVLVALDPANGRELWRIDRYRDARAPQAAAQATPAELQRPRAFALWQADETGAAVNCARRVFLPTAHDRLAVLDALSGQPCAGFSDGMALTGRGTSLVTHGGLVIVLLAAGELRAFDALGGAQRWTLPFDMLGAEAAQLDAHGQLALDPAEGTVFVPGASQLAVATATGKVLWQVSAAGGPAQSGAATAQPALVALNTPAGPLPVVAQPTPAGELRLLRRESGRSIGRTSLQLLPLGPYAREDAWGLTVLDRGLCARHVTRLQRAGSVNPSNVALDVERNRLVLAVNDLPPRLAPLLSGARDEHGGPWLSIFGLPCVRPPWGSLMSVDLQRRAIVWQTPLGASRELLPRFLPSRNFGTPNLGGPLVTAGGLVFIAAAADGFLRAFDLDTGRRLWRASLPAAGNSTPISYRAGEDQRQHIVVTAGGNVTFGNGAGSEVLAFALPRSAPGR